LAADEPRVVGKIHVVVHAYHVIWGTYGFWLPNDPRGSWSEYVGAWELFRFGEATKVTARRSHAWDDHDHQKRFQAKWALKEKAVYLSGVQARAAARGFADRAQKSSYRIYACAILPQHVHMVIGRSKTTVEQMVGRLKSVASQSLREENLHPFNGSQTPWSSGCWRCYLNEEDYIHNAIAYVNKNPMKEGFKPQQWGFIAPWPSQAHDV